MPTKGTMFVEVTRLFFVVLCTAAGFWLGRDLGGVGASIEGIAGMVGCLAGYVGGGVMGRLLERAAGEVETRANRLPAASVVGGALGSLLGAVAGCVFALPIVLLLPLQLGIALGGLVVWCSAYLGFRVVGSRSVAVLEMMGLSTRPLVRAAPFDARDGLLVDTSVLMDGQLLTLARTGLLGSDLLVARFVLDELHGLADAPDPVRARRARSGQEALEALSRDNIVGVRVLDDEMPEFAAVDAKLIALARRLELRLLTNDAALARNAEIQGVPVCNLRRLAMDLAPAVLPGDSLRLALSGVGRQRGQGVGHLDDGSLVVVNGGADFIGGPEVSLHVASVVPTSVGRVVFASIDTG